MTDKSGLIQQTNLAFDFLQKLYMETSYLIKEIEGLLGEEEERFIIGKPNGYHITTRSSTGLEAKNVNLWLLRKFAVFFAREEKTQLKAGQTITPIGQELKVLHLRVMLNDEGLSEPAIYSGVLYNIYAKPIEKRIKKFESLMSHIEYHEQGVFKNIEDINYEDASVSFQGELIKRNLFDINDSDTIVEEIIKPSLELYRKH